MIEVKEIGKSAVKSGPLGLGTNKVGGHNLFAGLVDETGKSVVKAALADHYSMLDTAFMYGLGRSEELIGDVLATANRSSIILADKAAHDLSSGEIVLNNSPKFLKSSVDEALKRLKTDYIDIFYIHFPDDHTDKAEAVNALNDLKKAGKIRAIGVSNFTLAQVKEGNQDGYIDVVENHYSLLHREPEGELFTYLKHNQISFVPYLPLEQGLLTGRFDASASFPDDDRRAKDPLFTGDIFKRNLAAIDKIRPIAERHQATLSQIMLAWYMENPAIAVVIPGARTPAQVHDNAKSLTVVLSEQDYQLIDQTFKF